MIDTDKYPADRGNKERRLDTNQPYKGKVQ